MVWMFPISKRAYYKLSNKLFALSHGHSRDFKCRVSGRTYIETVRIIKGELDFLQSSQDNYMIKTLSVNDFSFVLFSLLKDTISFDQNIVLY